MTRLPSGHHSRYHQLGAEQDYEDFHSPVAAAYAGHPNRKFLRNKRTSSVRRHSAGLAGYTRPDACDHSRHSILFQEEETDVIILLSVPPLRIPNTRP